MANHHGFCFINILEMAPEVECVRLKCHDLNQAKEGSIEKESTDEGRTTEGNKLHTVERSSLVINN